jgi:hypothetical protein
VVPLVVLLRSPALKIAVNVRGRNAAALIILVMK